jgi:hypothetical protein
MCILVLTLKLLLCTRSCSDDGSSNLQDTVVIISSAMHDAGFTGQSNHLIALSSSPEEKPTAASLESILSGRFAEEEKSSWVWTRHKPRVYHRRHLPLRNSGKPNTSMGKVISPQKHPNDEEIVESDEALVACQ